MSDAENIRALARDIVERRTGAPAYLCDEEMWSEALEQAKATYRAPEPLTPLQEAVRKARHLDPVEFINAYNDARLAHAKTKREAS